MKDWYPEDFIGRVREASNIVEIVSEHTQLKKAGAHFKGLCPLPGHNEKTPSFTVKGDMQLYYCFGCQRGGDIFKFVEEVQGKNFVETLEYLAAKASIPMPVLENKGRPRPKNQDEKKTLYKINKYAETYYQKTLAGLSEKHPARQYLVKRGITEDTIKKFKLGYASSEWEGLVKYFDEHRVPKKLAEKLGLLRMRKSQDGHFDLFRERVMFPIVAPNDHIVGFGGRIIQEGEPKYLNSPESPVFHKGNTFYGLREAAPFIRQQDCVLVVEGYMDVLALYQGGFQNVVATLGTALTHDHAKHIRRYTHNVIVLFDGDAAGQKAAERTLPILLSEGLFPRAMLLPDQKDPDDYINEFGVEKFNELLSQAPDLFTAVLAKKTKTLRLTPTSKVQVLDEMGHVLGYARDGRLKELYVREMAERLNEDVSWIQRGLSRSQRTQAPSRPEQQSIPTSAPQIKSKAVSKAPKEELMLTALALKDPKWLVDLTENGHLEQFSSVDLTNILKLVHEAYRQNPSDFARLPVLLSSKLDDPALLERLMDPLVGDEAIELRKLYEDCIRRVRERFLKEEAMSIINNLGLDQDAQTLERFMNIQKDRSRLKRNSKLEGEAEQ